MPVERGAHLFAVYECTGDCRAAAFAFTQEIGVAMAESGVQADFQRDETDTAALLKVLVPNQVPGKQYPAPLPPDLAPWYIYPNDCGHSLAVVPAALRPAGDPTPAALIDLLTPVPVRTVERLGYTVHRGFVVCPIDYDPAQGAVYPPDEDEW